MIPWRGGPFWQVLVSWQCATESEGQEIEQRGALPVPHIQYRVARHVEFAVVM